MTPRRYDDSIDSLDEYIENTPLEARFDPMTIQLIVTEAVPKHAAYGMQFNDYFRERKMLAGNDESETRRLTFYFPSYLSNVATDLSTINKLPTYPFITALTELGLIHIQTDYIDDLSVVKDARLKIFTSVRSDESHNRYMQLEKQTIDLGSAAGARKHRAKQFAPMVPIWFHNAVTELATRLNMSTSDLVFFAWCYGATNNLPEEQIPEYIRDDIVKVVKQFNYEIRQYSDRVTDILNQTEAANGIFRNDKKQ